MMLLDRADLVLLENECMKYVSITVTVYFQNYQNYQNYGDTL